MASMLGRVSRVVVGMSGGVDSTVSALALKRKGYEVIGVFMRNWDDRDETGFCSADKDCEQAEWVASRLGIKFHTVNLVKEYWTEVFEELVNDYRHGLTPNPDILCNSKIKFAHFFDHATNNIGCDAIATGHYARNSFGPNLEFQRDHCEAKLLKAVDGTKDQTLFLGQIPQKALRRTMFPVGGLMKSTVKKIARDEGFEEIANKKESMGICFVGKKDAPGGRGFQEFIAQYVVDKPGNFVHIETGEVIGHHSGLHQWTLGQRARIQRDGTAYFIISKNIASNEILVANDSQHPALYADSFFTSSPHWISSAPLGLESGTIEAEFRSQNCAPLTQCTLKMAPENRLLVSVAEPLRAITPGQFAVFYQGDICLGSARIQSPGPSLFCLSRSLDANQSTKLRRAS